MKWLNQIAGNHNEWVSIVRSFGEDLYAEDIVQECYIRLLNYSSEEQMIIDGNVNNAYMYFVLRNTYLLMHRGHKPSITPIEQAYSVKADEDGKDRIDAYIKIEEKIQQEVSTWHWYDQKLWKIYRESAMSIRKIAKETNISSKSIFVTLKHCKERIKVAVGEDYQDYINEDFELIQ